ncbi:MAG TPA: ABC transporter permease [Catenuloplanes sp.]|jgi:putative ABC transport system permease protein
MTKRVGPRSRLRITDLVREILQSLACSPVRAAGTASGVVLASAAFVATYGLAATLSHQVSDAFDAARATEVSVTQEPGVSLAAAKDRLLCPEAKIGNVTRLSGVTAAGPYHFIRDREVTRGADEVAQATVPVVGVDPGSLTVLGPRLVAGRLPDDGHTARRDAVGLISQRLAERLGGPQVGLSVQVAGKPITVIGVFDDLVRRPEALDAVLMPHSSAARLFSGSISQDDVRCGVIISTAPGAASALSHQVAVALSPQDPQLLTVVAPPDPQGFRRQLEAPVRVLTLALTGAALLIGLISIGTSASASVANRISEIGLRKAIGARSSHILLQLLGESMLLGLFGSVVGVFVGALVVVGVSFGNGWSPILDVNAALLACLGGSVLGALAGLSPAVRAARTSPVASLRR